MTIGEKQALMELIRNYGKAEWQHAKAFQKWLNNPCDKELEEISDNTATQAQKIYEDIVDFLFPISK